MKLLNAFSLNMIRTLPVAVEFRSIEQPTAAQLQAMDSCVGHADLATILGVVMNRATVTLAVGDEFTVAQYIGPRLAEGTIALPEGARIEFIQGKVVKVGG